MNTNTYIWRWAHNIRNLLRQSASYKAISMGLHNDPDYIMWLFKLRLDLEEK